MRGKMILLLIVIKGENRRKDLSKIRIYISLCSFYFYSGVSCMCKLILSRSWHHYVQSVCVCMYVGGGVYVCSCMHCDECDENNTV
jgi:hypothetical protein